MLNQIFTEAENRMKKVIKSVRVDFGTVRTGRANPDMFETVMVNYYGSSTPLNQLAKIQIPEAKQVIIQPYDKGCIEDIEKALLESKLGLNPNNDGNVIRINIPDLTEERRKELTGVVKEYVEDGKITLRKIRRDARDEVDLLESESEISEDEAHRAKQKIQEMTKKYEAYLDELLEKKTEEIMSF